MNNRFLLIVLLAWMMTIPASAQTDYTAEELAKTNNWQYRLGKNKRDSTEAYNWGIQFVKGWRQIYNNKISSTEFRVEDCKPMYRPWKQLMELAPYSITNLWNTGAGFLILKNLLEHEPDDVMKYVYFKDIMSAHQFRIKNYKKLNAIPEDDGTPRIPLSLGSALMWKAHDYHTEGMKYLPQTVYRPDSAYQYFVKAFAQIRKESVGTENEINPGYLQEYFEACRDLYMTDKEKYMEQFLTDYTTCLETCDKMMAVYANGVDSVKWGYYAGARNNTQVWFNQTGAGSAANQEAYFGPRLDDMKDDYTKLKNAVHLMMTNDSMLSSNVFYKACRYSYKQHPDFENCIGMAQMAKNQLEDRDEALKYFNEAEKLAENPSQKFVTSAQVGLALMSEPRPGKATMQELWDTYTVAEKNDMIREWQSRQNVAARKLNEALEHGLQAGINGQNLAPYYLFMAQAFRRAEDAQTINLASQALDQIPLIYPAFPENKIQDERNNIANVRNTIAAQLAREEQYKKDKAKYEQYQRQQAAAAAKRKAEEDFWSKK